MAAASDITLSVVIPAYKEQERIGSNLTEIIDHLGQKDFNYEIIVVIDGSHDDTAQVIQGFITKAQDLRIIENAQNKGKGFVIRQGLMEARGKYHVFLDADGSTSITHIDKALQSIIDGADFVVGSRDISGATLAKRQPRHREIMGTMGNLAIRGMLGLWQFPDTQCGFKVLRSEVTKDIVPRMHVDRFAYDFELIVLAKKRGYKIVQMPVRWEHEEGTTVGGLFGPNGFVQVLIDLVKTRMRLWGGVYKLSDDKGVIK